MSERMHLVDFASIGVRLSESGDPDVSALLAEARRARAREEELKKLADYYSANLDHSNEQWEAEHARADRAEAEAAALRSALERDVGNRYPDARTRWVEAQAALSSDAGKKLLEEKKFVEDTCGALMAEVAKSHSERDHWKALYEAKGIEIDGDSRVSQRDAAIVQLRKVQAERDQLRAKVERLEGAMRAIHDLSEHAVTAEVTRAALAE